MGVFGLSGIAEIFREIDVCGGFLNRRAVVRAESDWMLGIAGADGRFGVLDLGWNFEGELAVLRPGADALVVAELELDAGGLPERAIVDLAGEGEFLAVRDDAFLRQTGEFDEGEPWNAGEGSDPAAE